MCLVRIVYFVEISVRVPSNTNISSNKRFSQTLAKALRTFKTKIKYRRRHCFKKLNFNPRLIR